MEWTEIVAELRLRAAAEKAAGAAMFFDWPDRWWEANRRRCENDHVSGCVLKSEALGRDACLACNGRVTLTFPEDVDGPLPRGAGGE